MSAIGKAGPDLTGDFGGLVADLSDLGYVVCSTSRLGAPKAEIRQAFLDELQNPSTPNELKDLLRNVYLSLAMFQDSIGHEEAEKVRSFWLWMKTSSFAGRFDSKSLDTLVGRQKAQSSARYVAESQEAKLYFDWFQKVQHERAQLLAELVNLGLWE